MSQACFLSWRCYDDINIVQPQPPIYILYDLLKLLRQVILQQLLLAISSIFDNLEGNEWLQQHHQSTTGPCFSCRGSAEPKSWKCIEIAESIDSKIGHSISPNEEHLCSYLLGNVSNGISTRTYVSTLQTPPEPGSTDHPIPHNNKNQHAKNKFGFSQHIKWLRCSCEKCPVQYQIRRGPGQLAVYKLANHKHTIRAQIGLSIDTKAALDPYIQQANGSSIFIKKLCETEFPSADIRSVLLNGPGMLFQDNWTQTI